MEAVTTFRLASPMPKAMTEVLSRHKDGEKNFDCIVLPDQMEDGSPITRPKLRAALNELFKFDGDVLLYFSGHGFLSKTGGLLCTSDATTDDWGIPMQEVVDLAMPVAGTPDPPHPRLLPQR